MASGFAQSLSTSAPHSCMLSLRDQYKMKLVNSTVNEERANENPLLAEELWAIDGCLGGKVCFLQGSDYWERAKTLLKGHTPMCLCVALTGHSRRF